MEGREPLSWWQNTAKHCLDEQALIRRVLPENIVHRVRKFHRTILGGRLTPLHSLDRLANLLGVGNLWVKDESQRLTLNSFKVLGGSYAVFSLLQDRLGISDQNQLFSLLASPTRIPELEGITFAAATDGNHGRGVAWAASRLHCPSEIYVHEATAPVRIQAIESYGARVSIIPGTYDDAVRKVQADAARNGWILIADTASEGYEETPIRVMQGYTTMFSEIQEQVSGQGFIKPSHILVQAGVGSLAAAIIAYYQTLFGQAAPCSIVVEPSSAACLLDSAQKGDGQAHLFPGDLDTIMAGLACGAPSSIAWEILRDCADFFIAAPDYVAAKGMRVYGIPLSGDPFIVSGESGAVTLGVLMFLMQLPQYEPLRREMKLGPDSQVLLINTEGNTDPAHFRQVVWEGSDPVPADYRSI